MKRWKTKLISVKRWSERVRERHGRKMECAVSRTAVLVV